MRELSSSVHVGGGSWGNSHLMPEHVASPRNGADGGSGASRPENVDADGGGGPGGPEDVVISPSGTDRRIVGTGITDGGGGAGGSEDDDDAAILAKNAVHDPSNAFP